jgi:hypothetical protein
VKKSKKKAGHKAPTGCYSGPVVQCGGAELESSSLSASLLTLLTKRVELDFSHLRAKGIEIRSLSPTTPTSADLEMLLATTDHDDRAG